MAAKKKTAGPTKKKTSNGANVADLLFHAMYLMAIIDGGASEEELQVVEGLLTGVPEFGKTTVDKLVAASESLVAEHAGPIASLLALTDIAKKPQRVKCFLLAAEVAFASGGIGAAEKALLKAMAKVLQLDADTTKPILKVLGLKYTG